MGAKKMPPDICRTSFARKKTSEIICLCNNVPRDLIEKAIVEGAITLGQIFDSTNAGVGACGGSCRRKLGPLLESYLLTGTFPEKIVADMTGKKTKV